MEFFHTDAGDPYAIIPAKTHNEIWPLDGRSFRVWLSGIYYKHTFKPINSDAVQQTISTLVSAISPTPFTEIIIHDHRGIYKKSKGDQLFHQAKVFFQK